MAGIRLAEGCDVLAFAVVHADELAWTPAEGRRDGSVAAGRGAVVLTVAGDGASLLGTDTGAAKVSPLELYPTKGRGTGGVRSQRFLKGQNTLIRAYVGASPLVACTQSGHAVPLPAVDMRRDGSGSELPAAIDDVA